MLDRILTIESSTPTYWYAGDCPDSGELLQLPRTVGVEQIARNLMVELTRDKRYNCEGKMYGVLLVEQNSGEYYSIKAFSGLLNGDAVVDGWVPPIPGRDRVAQFRARSISITNRRIYRKISPISDRTSSP
jgi:tRNA pseudouridine32 synthase/23S rRNA pseudouridine746 synthase